MKKIIVFSDSHGDIEVMKTVVSANPDVKTVIHCGDCYPDAMKLLDSELEVWAVGGNCDFGGCEDEELVFNEGGKDRIFITHGYSYGVKYSFDSLSERAKELKAPIALFGHTHIPVRMNHKGIFLINPGSISRRKSSFPSYAVLDINENGVLTNAVIKGL